MMSERVDRGRRRIVGRARRLEQAGRGFPRTSSAAGRSCSTEAATPTTCLPLLQDVTPLQVWSRGQGAAASSGPCSRPPTTTCSWRMDISRLHRSARSLQPPVDRRDVHIGAADTVSIHDIGVSHGRQRRWLARAETHR